MSPSAAERSPFRVVRETEEATTVFCGHCAEVPAENDDEGASRVCAKCGMGLLLQAPAKSAPTVNDPFLVVDGTLAICAVSKQAEKLLGISETEAVNRHVAEFIVPGDSEAPTRENLAALLTWAARGETPNQDVVVRPANTFGVRYWARVSPCGPPTAALLILADAR